MTKRLQALLALLATVLMVSGSGLMISSASATGGGNNGTIKIHEKGTPSGSESNDPKVCSFNIEGFGFDAGQTGYVVFDVQGGDEPIGTPAGPFEFGPTNQDGFYATEYYSLNDGHYKATLYGKFGDGGINYQDVKAKSKVFKVECAPVEPEGSNNSSSPSCEKITVGTPTGVKPEGATVVVKLDGVITQPGTYDATPGSHVVTTYVNGVEVDKDTVTVEACPLPPAEPEGAVVAVSNDCETITFSSKDVKPEDAEVVLKLDGVAKPAGTYDVAPGSHTVELWVNGKKVDSKTVTVEKCEVTPPPEECPVLTGSVKTTLADGSVVNGNIYDKKTDVYVSGSQLGNVTKVYIRVTDPSGSVVLSAVKEVTVTDGSFGPVQLPAFNDTPNNGGEYKVWVSSVADFEQACTKFDNFKVRGEEPPPPSPQGTSKFTVDCETLVIMAPTGVKPEDAEYQYYLDGEAIAVGSHELTPGDYVLTLKVNGMEVDSDMLKIEKCGPTPTPVSPTAPTPSDVCEPATGPTNDRITIPFDVNFTYHVDARAVIPGPYVASGTSHTVRARPQEGVVVKEGAATEWIFTFTKEVCSTSTPTPTPTPTETPTPTPTPTETPSPTPTTPTETPTPSETPTPTPSVGTPTATSVPTPTATPTFVPPSAGGGEWPPSDFGSSDYSFASMTGKVLLLGGFAIFLLLGYERWGRRRQNNMA